MRTKTASILLMLGLIVTVFCAAAAAAEMDKININTATVDELVLLKGIGKVNAEKIVEFRDQQGKFGSIEELMNVKGIGEKTFEKNKDRITVE